MIDISLFPDRKLHGRGLIDAFDHHRRAQLEHPRSSCAGSDHINYKLQIEPCLLSQDHRLSCRHVIDCDKMVSDKFHFAAIAELSWVGTLFRKISKQGHTERDRVAVAARVYDEIVRLRLRSGSAERTIERDVASFTQEKACRPA
jgi:hypothetical protein